MRKKVWLLLFLIIALARAACADPLNGTTVEAQAGNITQLTIQDSFVRSNNWQGFFGNITGTISLDNVNNYTMYAWDGISNPVGEIYAANESVTNWGGVLCLNLSSSYKGFNCTGEGEECLNVTELEDHFSIGYTDVDGFDETFNKSLSSMRIGTKTLGNCPMVSLFVNDSTPASDEWNETILSINNTETLIFASVINHDTFGFNNVTWDFQMIVADDGTDAATTTYFMYTELT